jgi:hypothetical protein
MSVALASALDDRTTFVYRSAWSSNSRPNGVGTSTTYYTLQNRDDSLRLKFSLCAFARTNRFTQRREEKTEGAKNWLLMQLEF